MVYSLSSLSSRTDERLNTSVRLLFYGGNLTLLISVDTKINFHQWNTTASLKLLKCWLGMPKDG